MPFSYHGLKLGIGISPASFFMLSIALDNLGRSLMFPYSFKTVFSRYVKNVDVLMAVTLNLQVTFGNRTILKILRQKIRVQLGHDLSITGTCQSWTFRTQHLTTAPDANLLSWNPVSQLWWDGLGMTSEKGDTKHSGCEAWGYRSLFTTFPCILQSTFF